MSTIRCSTTTRDLQYIPALFRLLRTLVLTHNDRYMTTTPDLLHAALFRLLRTIALIHDCYSTMTRDLKHLSAFRRVRFMSLICEARYTTMTPDSQHTSSSEQRLITFISA